MVVSAQEVPKCKPGDEECIIKSANLMLKHFAKGKIQLLCSFGVLSNHCGLYKIIVYIFL